jgi:hypothetical protein
MLVVILMVKTFPTYYGTGSFITVFTRARHLSLFLAKLSYSPSDTRTRYLYISFNIILTFISVFPSGLFPLGVSTKTLYVRLISHVDATSRSHMIPLDLIVITFREDQVLVRL